MRIKIGHSAYTGSNRVYNTCIKSDAVATLIERGVKRDVARAAVTYVLRKDYGYVEVYGGSMGGDLIEVVNDGPAELDEVSHSRQVLNANPSLALDLFHAYDNKRFVRPADLADDILKIKMGYLVPPPPREIRV